MLQITITLQKILSFFLLLVSELILIFISCVSLMLYAKLTKCPSFNHHKSNKRGELVKIPVT
jgi:hypothetical protein